MVANEWEMGDRRGISRRLSIASPESLPVVVIIPESLHSALGSDYSLLEEFGTPVSISVNPSADLDRNGKPRLQLRATSVRFDG